MQVRRIVSLALAVSLWASIRGSAAADECAWPPSQVDGGSSCYYVPETFHEWEPLLSEYRDPGSAAHIKLIDSIERKLKAISSKPPMVVDPQEKHFTRWESMDPYPTIEVGGQALSGDVFALPYSGLTAPDGVVGQLVYEGGCGGKPLRFDRSRHAGTIVVVEIEPDSLWLELLMLSESTTPGVRTLFHGANRRTVTLERDVPWLTDAERAGVAGVILPLKVPPRVGVKQFVPFTRKLANVPAVYAEWDLRDRLKKAARSGEPVTLRSPGRLEENAPIRDLVAVLPASEPSDDCAPECEYVGPNHERVCSPIVLATHSDGPNFFEENGVVALWSLAKHFAAKECRERDLVFAFAAAHFAREPGSMDDVYRRNRWLFERARAAVVIEHLGAKATRRDGRGKEKPESAIVMMTQHDTTLNRLMQETLIPRANADRWLRPVYWIKPDQFRFGEGKFLEAEEVPTIGFLTNPPYLLSKEHAHRADYFCPSLMCKQIDMFRELVGKLMALD